MHSQFTLRNASNSIAVVYQLVNVVLGDFLSLSIRYKDPSQRSSWKKYSYFLCIYGNCNKKTTRWQLSRCRNETKKIAYKLSMMCVFEMLCSTCNKKSLVAVNFDKKMFRWTSKNVRSKIEVLKWAKMLFISDFVRATWLICRKCDFCVLFMLHRQYEHFGAGNF